MKPLTIKWRDKEAVLINEWSDNRNEDGVQYVNLTFLQKCSFGVKIIELQHRWYPELGVKEFKKDEIDLTEGMILDLIRFTDRPNNCINQLLS